MFKASQYSPILIWIVFSHDECLRAGDLALAPVAINPVKSQVVQLRIQITKTVRQDWVTSLLENTCHMI